MIYLYLISYCRGVQICSWRATFLHLNTSEPANQGFFRITKNFQTGAKKLDTLELDI